MRPCGHCGLGDKALFRVACRWKPDGVPPCEYDEAERERAEDRQLFIVITVSIAAVLTGAAVAFVFF